MYPELFHLGPFTAYSYGLFIVFGLIFSYLYLKKEWRKIGLNSDDVTEVFLWSIFGVVLGGKIFFFFENPQYYSNHAGDFFRGFGNGFVFYGSFLVTIPILIWIFRKKKLNIWEQLDNMAICGAIVHAFGKIGCFMAGCCYGKTCDKSWYSIKFTDPHSIAQPLGQYLYATQIWDFLIVAVILAIMVLIKARKQFHSQLFLIYSILYGVGRYFTEIYRGDDARGFLFNGSLSHSQLIAIIIVLFSLSLYIYKVRRLRMKLAL